MKIVPHWLIGLGTIAVGTLLRFSNLAAKPLWQDEVITALLSLGQGYRAVPLDRAVPLTALSETLTLKPTTCAAIAQLVMTQSVHPPLFFCALHEWLAAVPDWSLPLAGQLRAMPALVGVGTIAAVYALNRIAFSPQAGLLAAGLMAVSPFAVYLSQEARHYTLPMGLITIALVCLLKILQDWQQGQRYLGAWLVWVAVNSVGFYVHYFFILAVIAQVLTLAGLWLGSAVIHRQSDRQSDQPARSWRHLWLPIAAISTIFLTYVPWLPTFFSHLSRPETDWLKPFEPSWVDAIAPLWQFPVGWLLMVIALPVEQQPLWIAIPAALLTLLFAVWLGRQISRRLRLLWQNPIAQLPLLALGSFVGWVLLEFLAIVYLLHKDITQIPRYNFIYYPAVCALLGAILAAKGVSGMPDRALEPRVKGKGGNEEIGRWRGRWPSAALVVLVVGFVSSLFVVTDQVLHKPYLPERVAQDLTADYGAATLVVMSYENLQDVALGLSFALALQQVEPQPQITFALMTRSPNYAQLWQTLRTLNSPSPRNLWIIGPGLRQRDFPPQLALARSTCALNPQGFHRIGIPYQGYRCENS